MSELQQSCNSAATTVHATELRQALGPQWLHPALCARLIVSLPSGTPTSACTSLERYPNHKCMSIKSRNASCGWLSLSHQIPTRRLMEADSVLYRTLFYIAWSEPCRMSGTSLCASASKVPKRDLVQSTSRVSKTVSRLSFYLCRGNLLKI